MKAHVGTRINDYTESRATAPTASSKARVNDAKGPIKRKREVLAEVTEVNRDARKRPHQSKDGKDGSTTVADKKPLGVKSRPITQDSKRKTVGAKAKQPSTESSTQNAPTCFTLLPENAPYDSKGPPADQRDDEATRVFKKRQSITDDEEKPSSFAIPTIPDIDDEPPRSTLHATLVESNPALDDDDNDTALWDDLDRHDWDDPLSCSEYVKEICKYFKDLEVRCLSPQ